MTAEVAVIIVNYRTADLAIAAVESVLSRRHGGRAVEVHLVDNASPGGDAARFSDAHAAHDWGGRVTLWLEDENHGFGRGNNVALKALAARDVAPEFVFLLNPDAQLVNEVIDVLAEALEQDLEAGAAGAVIHNRDGGVQPSAFRFPSAGGEVLETIHFGPLDRLFGYQGRVLACSDTSQRVDWVSGAAVMFRMKALYEVGVFDPGFFLYYEEVELMHRLARAGWTTLYITKAIACHDEGTSTGGGGRRPNQPSYIYESWRWYHLCTLGRGKTLMLALVQIPAAFLNVFINRLRGRSPTIPHLFFRDHWAHVVRPLLTRGRQ